MFVSEHKKSKMINSTNLSMRVCKLNIIIKDLKNRNNVSKDDEFLFIEKLLVVFEKTRLAETTNHDNDKDINSDQLFFSNKNTFYLNNNILFSSYICY